ncbi:acyltransferase [Bogoriella caseilytica]|uniref:Acetyltransferase-like isoleucine patch superfamily enzyme n=1 Tax=Bogoriella caseilytica TaxID=56055 RepID=A0A3N2BBA3_9MICO|nr:acyltransferase [Bogoriella caseilytica]ROR72452.1 acetyltransferase-like isoleucine patch superfamily enzyme [Bogoriella caseilytica]
MPSEDSGNSPFDRHHFDYSPWNFWSEASDEEQRGQLVMQQELMAQRPTVDIAQKCFISPLAAMQADELSLGSHSYIAAHAYVTGSVVTGEHCTVNVFTVVRGDVVLGDGVRIGAHTSILAFNHTMTDPDVPVYRQPLTSRGIRIGSDVWIGSQVTILDGVTIGDRAMVAAGSIVTKNVPAGAVVAGNPAVIKKWRVPGAAAAAAHAAPSAPPGQSAGTPLADRLAAFDRRARSEAAGLLHRSWDGDIADGRYVDAPGVAPTVRAHCDAVEIAAYLLDEAPPQLTWEAHRDRLRALQDPESGMIAPLDDRGEQRGPVGFDGDAAYHVLCVGYALDLLGSALVHPVSAVDALSGEELHRLLASQPWNGRPWQSGHVVDMLGTAAMWNRRHGTAHHETTALTLVGWLHLNADPHTGMWGSPGSEDGLLQLVNGFYRTTRGTYAQFGLPLPYPRAAIDTVLRHAEDPRIVAQERQNACNILDVAHPLWLLGRQQDYRWGEIQALARRLLSEALDFWQPGEGFSFAAPTGGGRRSAAQTPGLQGTEMWLAIIWYLADLLGLSAHLSYRPRGIHRPEPAVTLIS